MKNLLKALLLSFSLLMTPALLADVVNINKATAAALQENLPGIGEKKAQAIVEYRKAFGAFKTLDEIMEVKGIGEGIFKKIKADIALDKGITDLVEKQLVKKKSVKQETAKKSKVVQSDSKAKSAKKSAKKPAKKPAKKSAKKSSDKQDKVKPEDKAGKS